MFLRLIVDRGYYWLLAVPTWLLLLVRETIIDGLRVRTYL